MVKTVEYGKLVSEVTTGDAIIRLVSTAYGYVVTVRYKPEPAPVPFIGMPLARWGFRTEEMARICLDFMVASQRFQEAIARGEPTEHWVAEAERLSKLSRESIDRLGDRPMMGDPTESE